MRKNLSQNVMKLASAGTGDLPRITELLKACRLPFEELAPSHLVLWDGDRLAGVIGFEPKGRYILLRSLAVSEAYRGQGIALYLTGKAEEEAASRGMEEIFLLTLTAEDFFDKLGYDKVPREKAPAPIQETEEFKRLCPDEAICMRKRLV